MFIDNKYSKLYYSIVSKAKSRKINPKWHETHHIVPKSMGGKNTKENMVMLSPREHFICHALLCKMVSTPLDKRKMSYAFLRMKMTNNKAGYSRIGNGKLYERLRISIAKNISGENNPSYGYRVYGKNNPFFGKKHSSETRKQMSISKMGKQIGKDNPFYGKKHSESTRKLISYCQSESIIVLFEDNTEVTLSKKGDLGNHLGVCKSLGIQLCTPLKKHLWKKYNIKEIRYNENN